MASSPVHKLTADEYLAIERAAEVRSEFFAGEMFAMSGSSMQHSLIKVNILVEIQNRRRKGCRALDSDLRVKISDRMYTYPDVTVICGSPELGDEHQDNLLNPVVIFEVLSPSTERYDRGLKSQHYRTVASLRELVLVEQSRVGIEHYIRTGDNKWQVRDYLHLEDELTLDSLGISIPLSTIYEDVEFPAKLTEDWPAAPSAPEQYK